MLDSAERVAMSAGKAISDFECDDRMGRLFRFDVKFLAARSNRSIDARTASATSASRAMTTAGCGANQRVPELEYFFANRGASPVNLETIPRAIQPHQMINSSIAPSLRP